MPHSVKPGEIVPTRENLKNSLVFSLCWWLCTVPGGVVLAGAILSGLAVAGFAGVRCAACVPLVVLVLL